MATGAHDAARSILDRIDPVVQRRGELYVSFLAALLRYPTVSGERPPRPRREHPAFQGAWHYLGLQCERLGLDLRVYDGGEAGIIEWLGREPDAPRLGIATHLDVVPPVGTWHHPPFGGTVDEGMVWGRGAQDDKGPLAMVLSAIDALQEIGFRPRRTIQLLIGTYEETEDWPDMDRLLAAEGRPQQVLVPDGAFPLGIGEKGIVTVEWAGEWLRHGPEEPLFYFVGLDGGTRANVVPGEATLRFEAHRTSADQAESILEAASLRLYRLVPKAEVEVQRGGPDKNDHVPFTVTLTGKAAHAAFPQLGHNAALDALAFLTFVPGLPAAVARFAGFLHEHLQTLDASALGLDMDHPQMGPTTMNLGRLEMDMAGAHAHVNVRFPKPLTAREIELAFRQSASGIYDRDEAFEVHTRLLGRPQPPFLLDDEDHEDFLGPLAAAYETVTGEEAKRLTIAGTTYAKLFPLAVGFGPVDLPRHEPVLIHQTDERVSVERHLENVRIYAVALAMLAGDDRSGPDGRRDGAR